MQPTMLVGLSIPKYFNNTWSIEHGTIQALSQRNNPHRSRRPVLRLRTIKTRTYPIYPYTLE